MNYSKIGEGKESFIEYEIRILRENLQYQTARANGATLAMQELQVELNERDAQISILRIALESVLTEVDTYEMYEDTGMSDKVYAEMKLALAVTPAEATERVQGLVDALRPFAEYPLIKKSCDKYTLLVNPWGKEQKEIWSSDFDKAREALAKYQGTEIENGK